MAYAAVVAIEQIGPTEFVITISETDASPTDVATVDGLAHGTPFFGKVLRQRCVIESGDATSVSPCLGKVNPPTDDPVCIADADSPADTQGTATYECLTASASGVGGLLYHSSGLDGGSNNVVTTYYHIGPRW